MMGPAAELSSDLSMWGSLSKFTVVNFPLYGVPQMVRPSRRAAQFAAATAGSSAATKAASSWAMEVARSSWPF